MYARGDTLWFAFHVDIAVFTLELAVVLVLFVTTLGRTRGLFRESFRFGLGRRSPAWNFP